MGIHTTILKNLACQLNVINLMNVALRIAQVSNSGSSFCFLSHLLNSFLHIDIYSFIIFVAKVYLKEYIILSHLPLPLTKI